MPIGYSDIYLVLRAQNYASQTINQVSTAVRGLGSASLDAAAKLKLVSGAVLSTGTIMAGIGGLGLKFFLDSAKTANEYGNQASYAQTQTKGLNISLEQLKQVGLDIGTTVPLSIDQLQTGLFNIFSSTNVGLEGATTLLRDFAKAGVAGQAELEQVSRGTLQELNAYQVPVSEVNKLLDIQFQMVKVGVGTYEDFMYKLGNIVPVARASGQSIETFSGAWAFATRNAMGTAMAATSIARAMEELQKPKFQEGLKKLGINALDSHGNLKQVNVLMEEIATNPQWQNLVKKSGSVASAYTTLFGTGTIQARRFFNVAIPNYKQLNDITDQMHNSEGAMQNAYDTMFKQPVAQIELFKNNLYALKVQIGDLVAPYLVNLVHAGQGLVDWFRNLNPGVRDAIVKVGAFMSVVMVVTGVVSIFVGMIGLAVSGIMAFGFTAGAAIGILAGFVAAIVIIPIILYLIIKYHKEIGAWFTSVWNGAIGLIKKVVDWFNGLNIALKILIGLAAVAAAPILLVVGAIYLLIKYHKEIASFFVTVWHIIIDALHAVADAFGWLVDQIMKPINAFKGWLKATLAAMAKWWDEHGQQIKTIATVAWNIVFTIIKVVLASIVGLFYAAYIILKYIWEALWFILKPPVEMAFKIIMPLIRLSLGIITTIFKVFGALVYGAWKVVWYLLSHVVKIVFTAIKDVIKTAVSVIVGIISVFLDLITGHWSQAWNDIKKYVGQILSQIWDVISSGLSLILDLFGTTATKFFQAMFNVGKSIIRGLWHGIQFVWKVVTGFFGSILDIFVGFFTGIFDAMSNVGKNIVKGLWQGIKGAWHMIKDGITGLLGSTLGHVTRFLGIASPSKKYAQIGRYMAEGLAEGLKSGKSLVDKAHSDLFPAATVGASPLNTSGVLTAAMRNRGQATVINMPKGAVSITVNGSMSAADQKNLEDAIAQTMQKVLGNVSTRISATRAA